jgi:rhamnogalacturonan endolyase
MVFSLTLTLLMLLASNLLHGQQPPEKLNRGIVAVRQNERSVFISWRLLKEDPSDVGFNIYRSTASGKPTKLNRAVLTKATWYVDEHADFQKSNEWFVRPVVNGKEQIDSERYALPVGAPPQPYITVPLKTPDGYSPNDGSVGDLDGDGEYELVIHMTGRGRDNSHRGMTDEPILHAYELDGTLLWSINLGKNIREGAHYTQFMVYDLDGDGRAEIACKTADGTKDGKGHVIGDPNADHRNEQGYILRGPEYLTVFDGLTGAAIHTTEFIPPRHPDTLTPTAEQLKEIWGDGYGNRCDRFLACIAYLDGKHPSLIMTRGYYTRSVLTAWNFDNGKLTRLWTFDSHDGTPGNQEYAGQGNHNISVADVDDDGRDEIIYGACVIDDNGKGLYSTGLGHGDALHVSDLDPENPGLEVFDIQERFDDAGMHVRDARTGKILWKKPSIKAGDDGEGPGRGNAFDIDPRYPGAECWVFGAGIRGLFSAKGEQITEVTPGSCNFGIWWDGDVLRELLDRNRIMKWSWNVNRLDTLLVDPDCRSNNGSKATPVLSVDLFGDWREEVIWRTADNQSLRIYTTTFPTEHRIVTLMQDHVYRMGIAWQNVAYNQPPHSSRQLAVGSKQ